MLNIFAKKARYFDQAKQADIFSWPILTGFDFFDTFLKSVAEESVFDDLDISQALNKMSPEELLARYPAFAPILQQEGETRTLAFLINRLLLKRANWRAEFSDIRLQRISHARNVLGYFLSELDLGPVPDSLAISITDEIGHALWSENANKFQALFLRSFPNGPSPKLQRALADFLDQNTTKQIPIAQYEQEYLTKLELFIGRDPADHPILARINSLKARNPQERDKLLAKLDPLHRDLFDLVSNTENHRDVIDMARERLESVSPAQRGAYAAARATIKKAASQDEYWKELGDWSYHIPIFRLSLLDHVYGESRGHQKVLNRKMELTPDQAYLLIEDALGDFGRKPYQVELSSPVVRTLCKYVVPGQRPDLIARIQKDAWIKQKLKDQLLAAMTGEQKQPESPENKLQQKISEQRAKLDNALSTYPDLFFKLGNVVSLPTSKALPTLLTLDHQIFPYAREIFQYCHSVAQALQSGLNQTREVAELEAFLALAKHNLDRLEAGEGTFNRQGFDAFLKGETHNQHNRLRIPKAITFLHKKVQQPSREEVINKDQATILELSNWLEIFTRYQANAEFAGWQTTIAPSDTASKASAKWIKQAKANMVPEHVLDYLRDLEPVAGTLPYRLSTDIDLVRQHFIHQNNRFDKGVIWAAHLCDPDKAGPLLVDYVKRCFVTLPGVGIKAEKLGNAALWSLQNMPDGKGAPYLAHILARNKYPKVRKRINAALDAAAAEAGMTRTTLDELTAPDHQMQNGGKRLAIGQGESKGAAILTIEGSKVHLTWEDAKGITRKAPPKAFKDTDPDGIRAAKAQVKEIEQDLATQSLRLDGLYLKQVSWSFEDWQARYANHGTLALLARRLIWRAELPDGPVTILPTATGCEDIRGIEIDCTGARMHLWHPIEAEQQDIQAWRERLMTLEIQQPFKQVWREVYQLTEAERETATYSNRFAGHIVRQHQLMTLAQLNGWKCTHRMWVDAPNDEPSHIQLRDFGLYAEFWTQGAGGDEPPTLDSGAYIYLTTDRVKFHHLDETEAYGRGEELSLDQIPAIIFSEIMRHCDLLISVPSISLDSEWMDRGADAAHPNQWRHDVADTYWQQGRIADLGTAAKLRRDVLAAILPRLKNADAFTLDDRFLHVQGVRHAYAIHLGSGAVQLKPDARHICIVRAATGKKASQKIYLPFEGDQILSLVLSKALMLAQDDKITDPVILQQLP